ncbi:MAG: DNA polymerase IV, partial [Phycisphaeraceae bacterium]
MAEHRAIIHVDMDAFFASIAIRDDPSLRGRPVLVGRTSARSVVTAASYEARRFGCRSAMPMTVARRLCPHASVVSVPGERIREASRQIFAIFDRTAPAVEPLSVDEAFLDVTGMERIAGPPAEIARQLKIRIRSETGLTASAGVAPNKFLAKLASDMDKPDGLTLIAPGDVDRVLAPLPVERLWGVGPKTLEKMHALGLRRVSDLRRLGEARLKQHFGSAGEHYHRLAHGIDDRPVVTDHEAKSLGQECTFSEDVAEPAHVREVLLGQVEHVARRLRARDRRARGVSLKIRFGEFQTISRSRALPGATDLTDELWQAAAELFDAWAERAFVPVRLIGVAAERLTDAAGQMDLFPDPHR